MKGNCAVTRAGVHASAVYVTVPHLQQRTATMGTSAFCWQKLPCMGDVWGSVVFFSIVEQ